ncbi:recombination protein NinG [Undibacterium sp.]|uniref:recombination protein NinG n=1 Tax=Undibacterium sp. TaxID=1914977 RepID=UPI00375271F3
MSFQRAKPAKPKMCKVCRKNPVFSFGAKVCGAECATNYAVSLRAKQERIESKRLAAIDRINTRTRKDALKSIHEWIADTQKAFNAYIRLRDSDLPCICCDGVPKNAGIAGGAWDAGHYRSRGSAGHLRFNEDNCHRQLKQCNRYDSGNAVEYRIGLINRIGIDRVEALESDNKPHKWTIEELKEIKSRYNKKFKELTAAKQNATQV